MLTAHHRLKLTSGSCWPREAATGCPRVPVSLKFDLHFLASALTRQVTPQLDGLAIAKWFVLSICQADSLLTPFPPSMWYITLPTRGFPCWCVIIYPLIHLFAKSLVIKERHLHCSSVSPKIWPVRSLQQTLVGGKKRFSSEEFPKCLWKHPKMT